METDQQGNDKLGNKSKSKKAIQMIFKWFGSKIFSVN